MDTTPTSPAVQRALDDNHLHLLSLGYVISGAMTSLGLLMGLIYMCMGFFMRGIFMAAAQRSARPGEVPPPEIAWILVGIGLAIALFAGLLAFLKFRTAWCLKRRRSRTFCLVVAGLSCLNIPYGTLLGIGTFMVLGRASVIELFEGRRRQEAPEPASEGQN